MPDRVTELVAQDLPYDPPAGYAEIEPVGNFDLLMGRIYIRMDGEDAVMGFRVSPRHINAHGTCHGGMLASFADMLGYASRVQVDLREECNNKEILDAILLLAQTEGIFTEPAGGVSISVLQKMVEQGKIDKNDKVVCYVTGNGLKATEAIMEVLKKPKVMKPDIAEISAVVN